MKNLKYLPAVLGMVFVAACSQVSVSGQSPDDRNKFATMTANGLNVRWDVAAPHSGTTVTVSAPDGRVFRKEFKAGVSPEFTLTDKEGEKLPDGQYVYELRLTPVFSPGVKEALAAARGKDDEAEALRAERKRGVLPSQPLVQSGGFSILNGAVIVAGAVEEARPRASKIMGPLRLPDATTGTAVTRLMQHHARLAAMPDQVIPDDLIVQGSACVGLDCVNGEVFGFDTIRMKENNTRLQFDDTSVTAGFPTNNWQIRANSSANGGGSFLAFVDQGGTGNSETGTIVFEVDAGAPANSLRVSSLGRIGLRTTTPVLDVHANTTDTPAIRLEQNSGGGFTAQTWDIAGNEANFFIRDVTGGSRLPLRIRPGAPTSSVDIAASGNVGIGTAAPQRNLHVHSAGNTVVQLTDTASGSASSDGFQIIQGGANSFLENQEAGSLTLRTSATDRVTITSGGNVGIGTAAPTDLLSVNGNASKPGGGTWAIFSDERLKAIKGRFNSGLKAVMQLQPLRYEYLPNNALGIKSKGEHVGFGAQTLQRVIPEAVTQSSNGYLMVNNDPIIWTMLNAIKEQQKEIEQLKGQIRQLRVASRKRR
ncbi:MAG: tail fiber domain-containing protein [Pyrinomonadaceae bacterium]